jgi:hypothetical protein
MKTHNEMIQEWLQDAEFKREYDALAAEFALFDERKARLIGKSDAPDDGDGDGRQPYNTHNKPD